jgi:membrane fusion protein (multidrug efflux system)
MVAARIAFVGAALALSLTACSGREAETEVLAPPVATARVTAVDVEERISASGEIAARMQVAIAAEVSGRVTALLHEEGEAVARGDIVLEIDPERRTLELEAAAARAAKARASFERERRETGRVRTLRAKGVASESQLESADTALELAKANEAAEQAQLGVVRRALADASVSAPFAGLLARRHVGVGQFVQPGTPLIELVSLDPIDVVFHVAEIDSGRVRVGQRVDVSVTPYPDRTFGAVVVVVSPTIDPSTRTLRIKAVLPNPEHALRPGLFARADLGVATRSGVLLVPEEAVLQRSDGSVLFVLGDDDRVERRVVTTGTWRGASVEILEGVRAGDEVVTRGHTALVDGAVVRLPEGRAGARESGIAHAGEIAKEAL